MPYRPSQNVLQFVAPDFLSDIPKVWNAVDGRDDAVGAQLKVYPTEYNYLKVYQDEAKSTAHLMVCSCLCQRPAQPSACPPSVSGFRLRRRACEDKSVPPWGQGGKIDTAPRDHKA
ncbi:hypothetical protein J6590_027442 [Homalodisca vitripennis]|nr:hypothetical protein J6590_027442 [Homalodisca vitripennis]